ncbi:Putative protein of unknown function [Podospora comata]|uniref:Extracellular membrane protein CFEM domain-containing protein n=1 Tax=Podospora comata TaxID=48703 RepID=A0ABY6SMH2_PODCO|nr:Putative protein of unknown function [Podospora comata]
MPIYFEQDCHTRRDIFTVTATATIISSIPTPKKPSPPEPRARYPFQPYHPLLPRALINSSASITTSIASTKSATILSSTTSATTNPPSSKTASAPSSITTTSTLSTLSSISRTLTTLPSTSKTCPVTTIIVTAPPVTTTSTSTFTITSTIPFDNSTTPCSGQICGAYTPFPCGGSPLGSCLCGIDSNGKSFCFLNDYCSAEKDCTKNSECDSGHKCVIGSCCTGGKCVKEMRDKCINPQAPEIIFGLRAEMRKAKCSNAAPGGCK